MYTYQEWKADLLGNVGINEILEKCEGQIPQKGPEDDDEWLTKIAVKGLDIVEVVFTQRYIKLLPTAEKNLFLLRFGKKAEIEKIAKATGREVDETIADLNRIFKGWLKFVDQEIEQQETSYREFKEKYAIEEGRKKKEAELAAAAPRRSYFRRVLKKIKSIVKRSCAPVTSHGGPR
jgi:hypothetical protein